MTDKFILELGRPTERNYFVRSNRQFLRLLPNLGKAFDSALLKKLTRPTTADVIIQTFGKSCIEDFNEIVLLCGNGFGNGALKIVRGMFEKLVTAYYFHLNPDQADVFWKYHIVKLSKLRLDDIAKQLDPTGSIKSKFRVARKKGGRKRLQPSWTEINFVDMAQKVGLGDHIRNAYHLPIEYTHPSVTLVLSMLREKNGKIEIKENKPQRETAKMALPIAHFFLLELLRLQIKHFELNNDDPIFQQCIDDYMKIWKRKRPRPNRKVRT